MIGSLSRLDFGASLRLARKGVGLTMGDVAERAGLQVLEVSELERGRSSHGVARYVEALGVSQVDRGLLLSAANLAWGPGGPG